MDITKEVQYLRSIPMLSKLEESKLKLLAFTSQRVSYPDGEYLFHKNEPADSAYLVMQGQAEVLLESDDEPPQVVLVRGEGSLIGEMGVLSGQERSASIRANDGLIVLCIEARMFIELLTSNSEVALGVMRQLSDKLAQAQQANDQLQLQLQQRR